MRTDLESAVVPKGILAGLFLGEDATGAAGLPADALMLHSTAPGAAETEGAGDIRMVELACEPAEDGEGMNLVRRVSLRLLAPRVEEAPTEVLCRDVRLFDLKYHDGTEWQDAWDSSTRGNALPVAVQVTLELVAEDGADAGRAGYSVCRAFRIPCATVPEDTPAAAAP